MTSKPLTDAAVLLRTALSPRMTQVRLAKALGVSKQCVQSWLTGRTRPDPEKMAAIQRIFGIPMTAWTERSSEDFPKTG